MIQFKELDSKTFELCKIPYSRKYIDITSPCISIPTILLKKGIKLKIDGSIGGVTIDNRNGYLIFFYSRHSNKRRLKWPLHRLIYQLMIEKVQTRKHVHHFCQNQYCLNPNHMGVLDAKEHATWHHKHGTINI